MVKIGKFHLEVAVMKNNSKEKELLRQIHSGMRLKTKAPKRETPKTVYTRKEKHKRRFDASSYDIRVFSFPYCCVSFFFRAGASQHL